MAMLDDQASTSSSITENTVEDSSSSSGKKIKVSNKNRTRSSTGKKKSRRGSVDDRSVVSTSSSKGTKTSNNSKTSNSGGGGKSKKKATSSSATPSKEKLRVTFDKDEAHNNKKNQENDNDDDDDDNNNNNDSSPPLGSKKDKPPATIHVIVPTFKLAEPDDLWYDKFDIKEMRADYNKAPKFVIDSGDIPPAAWATLGEVYNICKRQGTLLQMAQYNDAPNGADREPPEASAEHLQDIADLYSEASECLGLELNVICQDQSRFMRLWKMNAAIQSVQNQPLTSSDDDDDDDHDDNENDDQNEATTTTTTSPQQEQHQRQDQMRDKCLVISTPSNSFARYTAEGLYQSLQKEIEQDVEYQAFLRKIKAKQQKQQPKRKLRRTRSSSSDESASQSKKKSSSSSERKGRSKTKKNKKTSSSSDKSVKSKRRSRSLTILESQGCQPQQPQCSGGQGIGRPTTGPGASAIHQFGTAAPIAARIVVAATTTGRAETKVERCSQREQQQG